MSLDSLDLPAVILMLASLIVVPLGVDLISVRSGPLLPRQGLKLLQRAALPAALMLAASFFVPRSPLATGLAVPWMLITWGLASVGLLHATRRRFTLDAPLGADVGLMLLSIGGTWALMFRLGRWPGGFDPIIAELTAVHFHYAGFALPVVVSLIAAEVNHTLTKALAPLLALAVLLLALGITYSPLVELLAAGLVVAVALLIATFLWRIAPRMSQTAARWLMRLAGTSLAAGAALAMLYAAGEFTGERWIDIPRMIPLHGLTMALGFALPALLGFRIHTAAEPPPKIV
ncbi:MAG: YndJ family protein [Planctomycetes bacterium]|nr:YndJ family protein [Planctomycetota bacterium]